MLAQPRLRSVRFVLSSRPPSVDGNMLYKRIVACSSVSKSQMVENRGRKTWCVKKKYVKYTQRPMHFLVSVMFQSFLTISVYVIFNIITITKYCVIVNRKTLKIVLYYKSFFLFLFPCLKDSLNRFLFDLQVIKIQKE